MGLGEEERLLDGLAEASAQQPTGAERDLPLNGLEAVAARVGPRVDEARQPGAPVGLDDREERHDDRERGHTDGQVPHRDPGDDEQRDQGEADDQRGPEVGLGADQQAGGTGDDAERHEQPGFHHEPRLRRQELDRVEDHRELHQLGGLELERAEAEPALRAVDLHPERGLDQDQQDERSAEQGVRVPEHQRQAVPGQHVHHDEADAAVHHVLDEERGAVALALQEDPRARGGVDHHRAGRQQAEDRGQQDVVLEGLRAS